MVGILIVIVDELRSTIFVVNNLAVAWIVQNVRGRSSKFVGHPVFWRSMFNPANGRDTIQFLHCQVADWTIDMSYIGEGNGRHIFMDRFIFAG